MRVPMNLLNLAWCAGFWMLRTWACHGRGGVQNKHPTILVAPKLAY